jgi:hypothetical protein
MTRHVTSTVLYNAVYRLNKVTSGNYTLVWRPAVNGKRRWYKLLCYPPDNITAYIDEGYGADLLVEIERRIKEARRD